MRKFGHTPVCHSARDFAIPEHNVLPRTVPKPHETGLLPSHNHKQTTEHAIHPENQTKLVGHYTAPRRKITKLRENLPLVEHFRILCRPGLLTAQHSFLFLFLFFLFSSPFFFSFLLSFLLSFPPFLFFPPPSFSLLLPRTEAYCPPCL